MFIFKLTALGPIMLLAALLFPKEGATWIVNLPGAPMVIDIEGATLGAYELKNTSGREIVSVTLGCVVMKKQKAVVVLRLPHRDISVVAGGSLGEAIVDAPYTDPYAQCVVKQKAKLAVVSVTFGDKTSWSFSESERAGPSI